VSENGSAIVLGVGPGLGAALARRFVKAGFSVCVAARNRDKVDVATADLRAAGATALGVVADATDEQSVVALVAKTEDELGPLGVAIYNAGGFAFKSILDLTEEDMVESWRRSCLGGFFLGREAARRMTPRSQGTILLTGATAGARGSAKFAAFAVGKFGLRALSQSMARELGPLGVHVAYVNIDGGIDSERTRERAKGKPADALLSPDAIAETYYQLHAQHRSAWSLEVDVRPWVEKF
jgi:NAD(P)-dependent dehydrogenase (short-subunit alcohol dehydrogenase family)